MDEIDQDFSGFLPMVVVVEISGFLAVVLMGIWTGHFLGGFSWQSDPSHQFNWHPLLMTIALIFMYGNGTLVYRIFRGERKKKLKILHGGIMFTAFILTVIALKAAFDSHNLHKDDQGNLKPIPNLYTMHSWLGLITVILFSFQWLGGLVTFLFPGLASHLRASYLPHHVFFGIFIFISAVATSLVGITEKTIWAIKGYADRDPGGVVANWIGVMVIIFAACVVYLATNPRFKRLPRPEDGVILGNQND